MQYIKQHMLLFGALVIVIVGGVWYGMTSDSGPESLIQTEIVDSSGSPSEDSADRELVESLLTLRSITLSGTIFSDPAFNSLQDFGTTIVSEPVGRNNPFAPLGNTGAATAPQSQSGTPRR